MPRPPAAPRHRRADRGWRGVMTAAARRLQPCSLGLLPWLRERWATLRAAGAWALLCSASVATCWLFSSYPCFDPVIAQHCRSDCLASHIQQCHQARPHGQNGQTLRAREQCAGAASLAHTLQRAMHDEILGVYTCPGVRRPLWLWGWCGAQAALPSPHRVHHICGAIPTQCSFVQSAFALIKNLL